MVRSLTTLDRNLLLIRQAVSLFREHDKQASAILMESFLLIATRPPFSLSQRDIASQAGISEASVNHIIARLGRGPNGPRLGGETLKLVEVRDDPVDGRRKVIGLTSLGRNLAAAMGRHSNSVEGED